VGPRDGVWSAAGDAERHEGAQLKKEREGVEEELLSDIATQVPDAHRRGDRQAWIRAGWRH
jgi:hypothetical protein